MAGQLQELRPPGVLDKLTSPNTGRRAAAEDLSKLSESLDLAVSRRGGSQATLMVIVRCRPLSLTDAAAGREPSTHFVDDKVVVVTEPQEEARQRPWGEGRSAPPTARQRCLKKEKRYIFDRAFDYTADTRAVYSQTVRALIPGVLRGLNATVFAYGATGSGKTHTMVGLPEDPGLMILSMNDIFDGIATDSDHDFEVTCSYCEVYNEIIYDLLIPNSGPLDLREDPDTGPQVANLSHLPATSSATIFELLQEGNRRRKIESTDANATSSRSHAVLSVVIYKREKLGFEKKTLQGKLTLVDLAGSERASETQNRGHQLKDSANINTSLLALANCINALGKRRRKGFVPFRNSKLTRLLKDALSGNSRTLMIATVSPSPLQYHHTLNTLKYADRAKEIKTHVRRNQGTVQEHVSRLRHMLAALQQENAQLKLALYTRKSDESRTTAVRKRRATDSVITVKPLPRLSSIYSATQGVKHLEEELQAVNHELTTQQTDIIELEDLVVWKQAEVTLLQRRLDAEPSFKEQPDPQTELHHQALLDQETTAIAEEHSVNLQLMHSQSFLVQAEVKRQRLLQHIAGVPQEFDRDRLRSTVLEGQLRSQKAQAAARAKIAERLITEQQETILCLWKALASAGMTPEQVVQLALDGGASLPRRYQPSAPIPDAESAAQAADQCFMLEQHLSGALAHQRQVLWQARGKKARTVDGRSVTSSGRQIRRDNTRSSDGGTQPAISLTSAPEAASNPEVGASPSSQRMLRSRYSDSGVYTPASGNSFVAAQALQRDFNTNDLRGAEPSVKASKPTPPRIKQQRLPAIPSRPRSATRRGSINAGATRLVPPKLAPPLQQPAAAAVPPLALPSADLAAPALSPRRAMRMSALGYGPRRSPRQRTTATDTGDANPRRMTRAGTPPQSAVKHRSNQQRPAAISSINIGASSMEQPGKAVAPTGPRADRGAHLTALASTPAHPPRHIQDRLEKVAASNPQGLLSHLSPKPSPRGALPKTGASSGLILNSKAAPLHQKVGEASREDLGADFYPRVCDASWPDSICRTAQKSAHISSRLQILKRAVGIEGQRGPRSSITKLSPSRQLSLRKLLSLNRAQPAPSGAEMPLQV